MSAEEQVRAEWPTTHHDAFSHVAPHELASRWAQASWPVDVPAEQTAAAGIAVRSVTDDLQELATMTALAKWLTTWTPQAIHRTLGRGASLQQVADAAGLNVWEADLAWRQWSYRQHQVAAAGYTMIDLGDHLRIAARLDAELAARTAEAATGHVDAADADTDDTGAER